MKKYLGIDLGTSSAKIILIDIKGNLLKEVTKEYSIYTPYPNWSEQNPKDWLNQIKIGLKKIIEGVDSSEIEGISFSGQMHGLIILDKDDDVIRPCILWNDGRSEKETEYLNTIIGKDKLSSYTGNIAFPGFTAPKILWLKHNEPENFSKINKIMLPKDYIVYQLTNKYVTDYSDASGTLLLDVKNKKWSSEMCSICDIKHITLPELHESYDFIGYVNRDICDEIGLSYQTKVVIGGADNAVSAIGTGTINGDKINLSLGTSGTVLISNKEFKADKENKLHSFVNSEGLYYQMGCILSAASCNKWWLENIIQANDYSLLENEIKNVDTGRLLFLPYLNGERCPYNDVNIRGGFINLSSKTTKKEMSKAILEGVTFALKDCLNIALNEGVKMNKVTVCGGGAKNKVWCQIIADCFNVPVYTLVNENTAALGAAMLAIKGCNMDISFDELIKKMIRYQDKYLPNSIYYLKYESKYNVYKQIYPLLKNIKY